MPSTPKEGERARNHVAGEPSLTCPGMSAKVQSDRRRPDRWQDALPFAVGGTSTTASNPILLKQR